MSSPRRVPRLALLALALLLVTGAASAATEKADPYTSSAGVRYYSVLGTFGSGHFVNNGADAGPTAAMFDGCVLAKLRPDTGGGRIQVLGLLDDVTTFDIDFDHFESPDGVTPGIMGNITLDSAYGQTPTVRAGAAAWGPASLFVDHVQLKEPVGDGEVFVASFYHGLDGVRDDATGTLLDKAQKGDGEVHVRVQTPDGALPQTVEFSLASPGDLPDGSLSPTEAFTFRHLFGNPKFGGTATARIASSANSPAGMTELTFAFLSPTGRPLANVTVAPGLLANDGAEVTFPLSEFGRYSIDVRGKASLAQYDIDVTLSPPKALDLDLWWEDVLIGDEATTGWSECKKNLGHETVPTAVVGRDAPPTFLLEVVILAVVVASAGVLVGVKLIAEGVLAMKLRKQGGG